MKIQWLLFFSLISLGLKAQRVNPITKNELVRYNSLLGQIKEDVRTTQNALFRISQALTEIKSACFRVVDLASSKAS